MDQFEWFLMKTLKALVLFFLFLGQIITDSAAATPLFDWYKMGTFAGTPDVAVDANGNVAWIYNEPAFPYGTGLAFSVRKYSPTGNLILSKTNNSARGSDNVSRIASDANGNLAILQAGVGNYSGYYQEGNFLWVGAFGKMTSSGGFSFPGFGSDSFSWGYTREPFQAASAIDSDGNCIFAFPFNSFSWAGQTWTATDGEAGIVKVSSTGSLVWFKKIVGPGQNVPAALAVDPQSNVYVAGFGEGQMAIDDQILTSSGGRDGFIVKFDKNGTLQWVRHPSCSGDDSITSLAFSNGGVSFAGKYRGTLTFGNSISSSAGGAYFGRVESNGSMAVANLAGVAEVSRVAASSSGNVVITGKFTGASVLNTTVANRGLDDVFVAEINNSGLAQWVKSLGYIYSDIPGSVAVANSGAVYVAAMVNSGVMLDNNFVSGGSSRDVLLAKLIDSSISQIPTLNKQPSGVVSYFGGQASFTVQSSSSVPVTYQWFRDGVPINLQTSPTLTFASVRLSDDANYYVEITNQYGKIRSDSVRLIVKGEAPVVVTTLAGTNIPGFVDSTIPKNVRFTSPNSLAVLGDGSVLIPDAGNHLVRILEPNGTVGTYAGKGLPPALLNGPASAAYFNIPIAVAVDAGWDVFVADSGNNVIRRISPFGARTVTTFAGSGGNGLKNGTAAEAQFNFPNDLVVDPSGNLFVTEFNNHTVRKITKEGVVTTFAGTGAPGHHDGPGAGAQFNGPAGIARDNVGNLFVTDWENRVIRKITPDGVVSTIAGAVGVQGFIDGPSASARLCAPDGIAVDQNGNIFFTEFGNSSVRRIDPSGEVLTLVGTAGEGFADGGRTEAKMLHPGGIAVYPDGSLIVADTANHSIRKVVWRTNPTPTEAALLIELNPSITIFGITGKTYQIQASENLVGTEWTILGEVTLEFSVETWFDSQPVTRGQRYYRAILKN